MMHSSDLETMRGLTRIEHVTNDEMNELLVELTHAVYPHAKAYPAAFTLEQWVNTSIEHAFMKLSQGTFIEQYSYSYRQASQLDDTTWQFHDISQNAVINCDIKVLTNAKVIDMIWSETESKTLIRHDSLRVIDANDALKSEGCIILLTSSRPTVQSSTDENIQRLEELPIDKAWKTTCSQRKIELHNIKQLLENAERDKTYE